MENSGKISVVVPVYNVEMYVDDCISSVVAQTYSDLEIIIVDDGSTDSSGGKCDEWAKKDDRIKIIHQPNMGLSMARNKGIEEVTGDFITYIDSDDIMDVRFCEVMLNSLICSDSDVVICGFSIVDESMRVIERTVPKAESVESKDIGRLYCKYNKVNSPMAFVWNKMYRTKAVREFRFEIGKTMEDTIYNSELFMTVQKVIVIEDVLYEYRQRNGSFQHPISESEKCEN